MSATTEPPPAAKGFTCACGAFHGFGAAAHGEDPLEHGCGCGRWYEVREGRAALLEMESEGKGDGVVSTTEQPTAAKGGTELFPCPHCGSQPAAYYRNLIGEKGEHHWIECATCGASVAGYREAFAVLTVWNTRAADPVRAELLAALQDCAGMHGGRCDSCGCVVEAAGYCGCAPDDTVEYERRCRARAALAKATEGE